MKILYITSDTFYDYQSDMLFHGLRSLYGDNVVDSNRIWWMYDDCTLHRLTTGMKHNDTRPFTLYRLLPELNTDRSDIEQKIAAHYFDKIVYGSITRVRDHLPLVLKTYNKNDIIFVDGEDDQNIRTDFLQFGLYYKRELSTDNVNGYKIRPINFCIPKERIVSNIPEKTQDYASIIPGDKSTYIYKEETPYYEDYQKSYFGVTTKKGGWDCLRHYEILMNGCVPYFPDLENCPIHTMERFPKKLVLSAMDEIKKGNDLTFYNEHVNLLLNWTREMLTTESVAKSVIEYGQ